MTLEKFVFRIRTRNGVVMERLQIQAADEAGARARLVRMYPHCEILATNQKPAPQVAGSLSRSFEDIADLLSE